MRRLSATAEAQEEEEPRLWHAEYVDMFGNLTLTAYNSPLSDRPFSEKRQIISEKLHLSISKEIADNENWNRETITKRSRRLAQVTLILWPYESRAPKLL